jgi:hypothetical protein
VPVAVRDFGWAEDALQGGAAGAARLEDLLLRPGSGLHPFWKGEAAAHVGVRGQNENSSPTAVRQLSSALDIGRLSKDQRLKLDATSHLGETITPLRSALWSLTPIQLCSAATRRCRDRRARTACSTITPSHRPLHQGLTVLIFSRLQRGRRGVALAFDYAGNGVPGTAGCYVGIDAAVLQRLEIGLRAVAGIRR